MTPTEKQVIIEALIRLYGNVRTKTEKDEQLLKQLLKQLFEILGETL